MWGLDSLLPQEEAVDSCFDAGEYERDVSHQTIRFQNPTVLQMPDCTLNPKPLTLNPKP